MINKSKLYIINIRLDNLYCIYMEGSWQSNFINYIEFDLYICENWINADESNIKCSYYEKIMNAST